MKWIIAALLALCVLPIAAHASYRDFTVVSDVNTTLSFGNVTFTYTVAQNGIVASTLNATQYQSYNASQYDIFAWKGPGTVTVQPCSNQSIVVPSGSQITLDQVCTYTLSQVGNDTNYSISVTALSNPTITVTSPVTQLQASIDTSSFVLDQSQRNAHLTINVPSDFPSGTYPLTFTIRSPQKSVDQSVSFVLPAYEHITMRNDNMTSIIATKSDSYNSFGTILFHNDGNSPTTMQVRITGEHSDYLDISDQQTLYQNSDAVFNLRVQIPSQQKDGNYSYVLNFSTPMYSYIKPINLSIHDLTPPQIINVSFDRPYYGAKNTIHVVARDNIAVINVTATCENGTVLLVSDQQNYAAPCTFYSVGVKQTTVCAYDGSSNSICGNYDLNFATFPISNVSNSLDAPTRRFGSFARTMILNFSEDSPNTIALQRTVFSTDIDMINQTPFEMQLVDSQGLVQPVLSENQTFSFSKAGPVYLDVKGYNVSTYTVQFSVTGPEYLALPASIVVRGAFKTYSVPQPFQINIAGKAINCIGMDPTGNLNDAYIDCGNLRYPISDDVGSVVVPLSVREKSLIDDTLNATKMSEKNTRTFAISIGGILLAVCIGALVWAWFVSKVLPAMRFYRKG